MKFRVRVNAVDDLDAAVRDELAWCDDKTVEAAIEEAADVCEKWFNAGGGVTLEIDTDARTCVVLPK